MKNFLKAAALCAMFASYNASASSFDFSYLFGDGTSLTGTLSGDLNGSLVTNISNVHVFLNGTEFSGGSLFAAAWNTTTHDWDNTIPAVVSTNAALNNFIFADADVPTDFGVSNYFYFVNDPASPGNQVFANNLNTGDIALDDTPNGSWSLTAVPTPIPAALPLLISGIGLLGAAGRRRAAGLL
ncbi:MAG: PEP-CTERM sorting domain-containing protein [Steroidobacter sp.]